MGLVGPVGLVSVCPIALVLVCHLVKISKNLQLVYMKIQITFLKVYDGCAFDPTMDLAPWCSTKVMFLHWNMVIGHENNVRRLLMVYYSMCHLMLYNSKLWGIKGVEGKQCAQVVDGVHQTGKGEWGYCDPACPCKSL